MEGINGGIKEPNLGPRELPKSLMPRIIKIKNGKNKEESFK